MAAKEKDTATKTPVIASGAKQSEEDCGCQHEEGGVVEAEKAAGSTATDNSVVKEVVYHGSPEKEITGFKLNEGRKGASKMQLDFGTHFTNLVYAKFYAKENGRVYAAHITIKHPLDLTKGTWWKSDNDPEYKYVEALLAELKIKQKGDDFYDKSGTKHETVQNVNINQHTLNNYSPNKVYNALLKCGFDGVIYQPFHPAGMQSGFNYIELKPKSYIVLKPEQISIVNEKASGGTAGTDIPPRYREMGFTSVGEKKNSTRPEKKWMVLAKKGDNFKVVHGGDAHMEDFSQHHDEKRRQRFWIRMGGKDSPQARDPFSPLYWHKKFKTWDAGGVLNDDAIKVVWIDTDKPETLESKMFDHLRDALRYAEGKTHLIMQLQEQEGDYYRWKLLPYGEHEKYKIAVDADNFFSLSGDGVAIDFKIGSIDLRMEQGGTAGAAEKKNELITDHDILAALPKGIGKTLTYREKYHNSIQHYFISEVPDYRDVHTNEVKPFLVNVRAIYPDGKEIDNAYASFKTLHEANTYIDYLVASDFREDKTVKPPYRQELGKKYDGLAESTATIMLKKKQLDQDYDWTVESFGIGRDTKFYLKGVLKNLPYKLPEVKETAETLTIPAPDLAKAEQWWNEISPTDRLKYVLPSMVEKHDLPEYTTDWHWNTLPAEVQQHIAAEMQKKEAAYAAEAPASAPPVIASAAKQSPVEHENVPRETSKKGQVKPIRKMGSGANVYFETDKYRVNDASHLPTGKVWLNVHDNTDMVVPRVSVEFDNAADAVRVAEILQKEYPKGVPPERATKEFIEMLRTEGNVMEQMRKMNDDNAARATNTYLPEYLAPLEMIPLSTQLSELTGEGWNGIDWTNEDGSDANAKPNNIIVNKKSGRKFRIPPPVTYRWTVGEIENRLKDTGLNAKEMITLRTAYEMEMLEGKYPAGFQLKDVKKAMPKLLSEGLIHEPTLEHTGIIRLTDKGRGLVRAHDITKFRHLPVYEYGDTKTYPVVNEIGQIYIVKFIDGRFEHPFMLTYPDLFTTYQIPEPLKKQLQQELKDEWKKSETVEPVAKTDVPNEETQATQYRRIVDTAWLFTKNQFIELVRKYDPYPVKDDLWLRNQESIHKAAVATAMQKKTGANRSEEQERSEYEVAINEGKLNGADVAEIIKSAGLQVPFYFRYRVFTVFKSGKPSQETEFNLTLQQANMLFEKMTKDPDAEIVTMDYAKDNEHGKREANVTLKMWTAPNVQSVTIPNHPSPTTQQPQPPDAEAFKQAIVEKSGIPAENLIVASINPDSVQFEVTDTDTLNDYFKNHPYAELIIDGADFWEYKIWRDPLHRQVAIFKLMVKKRGQHKFHDFSISTQHIAGMIKYVLDSIKQNDRSGSKPIRKAVLIHENHEETVYSDIKTIEAAFPDDDEQENNYYTPANLPFSDGQIIEFENEKYRAQDDGNFFVNLSGGFNKTGAYLKKYFDEGQVKLITDEPKIENQPELFAPEAQTPENLVSETSVIAREERPKQSLETPDLTNIDKTEIVQNETTMETSVSEYEALVSRHQPFTNWFELNYPQYKEMYRVGKFVDGDVYIHVPNTNIHVKESEMPDADFLTKQLKNKKLTPAEKEDIEKQLEFVNQAYNLSGKILHATNEPTVMEKQETPVEVAETADIAENPSSWFFDDNYFTLHPDHVLGTPYQTSGLHGEVTKYKGDMSALAGIKAPLDFLEAFPQDNPLLSVEPPTTQAAITTPEGQNAAETAIKKSRQSVAQKKKMKTLEQQSPIGEVPLLQDKLSIHREYNKAISNDEFFAFIWYYASIGRKLSVHWYDLAYQLGVSPEIWNDEVQIVNWVKSGILFYYGGFDERTGSNKLLHSAYYLAGNVKDRHAQLERDKDRIVELYGMEVFEAQKVAIDKAFSERKHNWLRIGGTEEKMPLLLLPNSEFAQKFMIEALVDEEPFHFRIKASSGKPDFFNADFKPRNYISYSQKKYYKQFTELSLTDAFCAWMLTDTSIIFKKGVTGYDIIKYYVMNGNMVYTGAKDDDRAKKQFEDYKMRMKQNTKQEGDRLFQEFLKKQLKWNDIQRIEYQWNGTYNSNVPVDYNKIPVVFECAQEYSGENPLLIKPEKREAAAFTFTEGAGCLAYGTGVGKTMSSIFTVAQFLYAGFAKRPLVVTPNQVYKQFIAEIKGILPQFNVLGLYNMGDDYLDLLRDAKGAITMVPENTICVMTYEGFKRLGFNEKTRNELIWQMYDILDQSEEANKMSDAKRTKFMEDLEALVGGGEKGGMVNIEDTGLDFFVLDEAHKMKKVFVSVKGRALPNQKGGETDEKGGVARSRSGIDIKGGSKPSQVALKGFMLCQYIMRNNYGSNVLLLTATPFTNSALEVYSMLSMVAFEKMKQYGVHNIVDFFDNFINMKYDLVINSRNQPEKKQIIDGFNNAYALNRMVTRFINRKSEDEVKAKKPRKIILPRIEKMENGVRVALDENEKIETFLPMTAEQERMMQEIIDYAEGKINLSEIAVKTPKKTLINKEDVSTDVESGEASVDTTEGYELDEEFMDSSERDKARYIRAINYAQMLAISPYLYKHSGKTNPTPKQFIDSSPKLRYIMDCIKSVKQWHDKQTDPLLRQMSGQIIYSNRGLEFFEEIRSYLIEVIGFKADEVEIITAKNPSNGDRSKSSIQDRFLGQRYNEASMMYEEIPDEQRVKVIIGSSVIKEGMNLQKFSSVLYNCYIEWNPTDVIQLEGRIWRQGNQFGAVRIVIPMLIDSIDIFLFQKLQEKTARINSIWQVDGKTSQIKLEEFDAEELKFALIRDARVLAKMKIESEEAKLREESSVYKQEIEKVNNIKEYVKDIENHLKDAQDWLAEYRVVKKRGEEAIWDYAKYLATTMNLVMRKPTDKEGRKIYDNTWSDEYKKDKNPSPVSYPRKPYWFEDFSKAQRGLVRAADSFLRPKNLTLNDLDGYTEKAQKEIEALEEEIVKIGDDKNIERMAREIEQERAEKNIKPKSLPEVVQDFIKLNDECLGSRSLFQKIGAAKPMFTTCPPVDANGNRLITPDAVKWLEACIAKDPDTKLLHSNALPDGTANYHPYREALHDEIIKILLQRAQCVKGNTAPIAVLTGGAPASGKTRWLKQYAPYIKDFVLHIDADEIRSALPEYKGWNANSTFNEAKDIVNKLLDKVGTPCTQDILYDGTMGNSEKYFKLVRKLKKMGYKVFVAFMDVPEAVAQERALERYQKYGRYVSHNVISSFYNQDDAGKPTLKQLKNNVDGYIVVDGITGEVKEQGGMEIPTDRPYLKAIASGLKDLKGKMDDAIKALEKLKAEGGNVIASEAKQS